MPVSLKAFLETYPNKTKACLEHICSALGISTNGTVVTLQARIVKYVEDKMKDNENLEEEIKDMASKFAEHKKNGSLSQTPKAATPRPPHSPAPLLASAPHSTPINQPSSLAALGAATMTEPRALTPLEQQQQQQHQQQQQQLQEQQQPQESQPTSQLLFTDSQMILERDSGPADPEVVCRLIDDLEKEHEELTLNGDEDEDFPGAIEARNRRMNHPFTHIEQSLWYEDEVEGGNCGSDVDGDTGDAGNDGNTTDEGKQCPPDSEKRMKILLDEAIQVVASKDSQIDMLEHQLNKAVEMTARMIEKTDSCLGIILSNSERTNQMVLDLKNEMQVQSTKATQLEKTISTHERELEQAQKQIRSCQHEVQMERAKIAQLEGAVEARNRELEKAREQIKQSEKSWSDQLRGTAEQLKETQRKKEELEQKLGGQSINSRLLNLAASPAPAEPSAPLSTTAPLPLPSETSVPQVALPSPSPLSSSLPLPPSGISSLASKSPTQKSQAETLSAKSPSPVTNGARPAAGSTRELPDINRAEEVIIVVTDSNGKHLNPELLHDTKKVVLERRATWEMARDYMPKPLYPASVTDVVLITGINNVMNENQHISDILQTADATARMYQNAFPNATIHLGSIAPANEKCLNYNFHLQDLATRRKAPFITIEEMYDRGNGQLKSNVLNGIHYTKVGIRPLAKQMKRSLYRQRTAPVLDPPNHQGYPQMAHRLGRAHQVAHPSQNAAMILETFFNFAKACLPQQ